MNPINLSPITQLIQQIKSAELSQGKEIKISIQQARLLSLALLELINKVNQDWESLYNTLRQSSDNTTISVEMDGGGFEEPK